MKKLQLVIISMVGSLLFTGCLGVKTPSLESVEACYISLTDRQPIKKPLSFVNNDEKFKRGVLKDLEPLKDVHPLGMPQPSFTEDEFINMSNEGREKVLSEYVMELLNTVYDANGVLQNIETLQQKLELKYTVPEEVKIQ